MYDSICCIFFQTNYKSYGFVVLLETIVEALYSVCISFVTCELGERFTIAYGEMDCEFKQFKWYLFPIEVQRLLPILVQNAQQPVTLRCFGSIAANREAFKKVPTFNPMKMQNKI